MGGETTVVRINSSAIAVAGFVAALGCAALTSVTTANAVTLEGASSDRGIFAFPQGDVKASSYDGPNFDSFAAFSSFVSPELLKINSFTGQPQGSHLDVTLLSEAAAFDGTTAGYANKFGVLDEKGDFSSLIDTQSNNPGATASLLQGKDQSLTFALQSPEGLFSSVDVNNSDGAAHMLAMRVDKAGEYEIAPTSLRGTAPIKFNFLEGDIILFIEDMRVSGNLTSFLVPESSDFDYNDMVFVVRQSEVPEPATLVLLGMAGLGAAARRKRQEA